MENIIIVIAGIVFFLIGIIRLSSSAQNLINARIKQYVKYIIAKPLYGLFTGIISTVMFQSSSASIVLTIGLVSAGLITFFDSLAIILGADIGTTLTVQFVVWHFTEISPLIISAGGLLWLIGKAKWKILGEIVFYFGLMFFGLELVSKSLEPLKESAVLMEMFKQAQHPWIGLLMGIVVTGIVQASAIPISIIVLLAHQEMISLQNAVPVIMGANIGTTVTAIFAGIVGTKSARRTAVSHLIFKSVGIIFCFIFMPQFIFVLKNLTGNLPQQIALAHFLLNLVIVFLFIFLLSPFTAIMKKIMPGEDEAVSLWPEYLDEKDVVNPQRALDNVYNEIRRQMNLVHKMYLLGISELKEREGKGRGNKLFYLDKIVINTREEIVKYLQRISSRNLSEKYSKKIFAYTAVTNDIASIGNHALCIGKLAIQKAQGRVKFSQCGENDLQEIVNLVSSNFEDAEFIIKEPSESRNMDVIRREEEIDIKVKQSRDNHLERFHKGICAPEAGTVFVEMLLHLERISDLCDNVAEYMCDIKERIALE